MITVKDLKKTDIKQYLKESNIPQWKVAEAAEIGEFTLSRWLRRNLETTTPENQKKVIDAINQLSK